MKFLALNLKTISARKVFIQLVEYVLSWIYYKSLFYGLTMKSVHQIIIKKSCKLVFLELDENFKKQT